MKLTRGQILILAGVLLFLLIGALIFFGILPGLRSEGEQALSGELMIWGIDPQNTISQSFIAPYQEANPEVAIQYRQFSEESYEGALVNALAAGNGPDIFMVKNTWIPKHGNKLAPLTEADYSLANLKQDFVDVVSSDFYGQGLTYALPLYVDSLTLFYNKDMFNNAGIINPPKTWEELNAIIPTLRRINPSGRIVQAAVALGGSRDNMARASDILSLFMLQDGVQMISEDKTKVSFSQEGLDSFKRYLEYANPVSENYSWSEEMRSAEDEFASESLAMIFSYSGRQSFFKEKNPFLNFAISSMPQKSPEEAVNYASYWGLAVANTSPNQSLAWNFIGSSLLNEAKVQAYSSSSSRPPALRQALINLGTNAQNEFLLKQSLTARSWYQIDDKLIQDAFSDAISKVLNAMSSPENALAEVGEKINAELDLSSRPAL